MKKKKLISEYSTIFYINGLIKIIEFSIRKYRSNTKKLLFETAKVASITAIFF